MHKQCMLWTTVAWNISLLKILVGNETHKNLLHEKIVTWIINKVCNEVFIYTCMYNTGIL